MAGLKLSALISARVFFSGLPSSLPSCTASMSGAHASSAQEPEALHSSEFLLKKHASE